VIVCAVDLSDAAAEALRQARELEASVGAELIVYHAFETLPLVSGSTPDALPPSGLIEEMKSDARQFLEATASRLPSSVAVQIEVEATLAGVASAILAKAEAVHASAIVVGTRVVRGVDRLLLGAVADEIVRHAHCSVLVARPSPAGARVLVAVDRSPVSLAAVHRAAREAQRRRLELTVVHCLNLGPEVMILGQVPLPPEDPDSRPARLERARQDLEGWLQAAQVRAEVLVEAGPPVVEVVRLAKQLPARMVVVGATGKTGLRRLLLGSVAEGITRKAPCSVLAVRLEERETMESIDQEEHDPEIEPLDGGVLRVPADIPESEEQRLERVAAAEEHQERERAGIHLGKI